MALFPLCDSGHVVFSVVQRAAAAAPPSAAPGSGVLAVSQLDTSYVIPACLLANYLPGLMTLIRQEESGQTSHLGRLACRPL